MGTHSSVLAGKYNREACWATVPGVTKSRTQLSDSTMTMKVILTPSEHVSITIYIRKHISYCALEHRYPHTDILKSLLFNLFKW